MTPRRRPARWLATALLLALGLVVSGTIAVAGKGKDDEASKQDQDEDDIDYVALAARMVKDGHFDRAAATLGQVDERDPAVDQQQLNILRGLVAMHGKLYAEAAKAFQKALDAGSVDPAVWLSLGQAKFGMNDYRGAVTALDKAGDAAEADPVAQKLRTRAYWELKDPGAALDVLVRAGRRFPDEIDFPRLEMFYLIELGLFRELTRRAPRFLERADVEAQDLAAMGEAMRKSGKLDEAKHFIEEARLRFPDDQTLSVLLSRVYMDDEQVLSAAVILEEVARLDPAYLVEAAEMYRRAGRLERALSINARIGDQKTKMKQRLQIQLELEQYEMISAMEARLSRLGLLDDQQIRYALAYGFFMIRDFEAAERHIRKIDDPDLFDKGNALRKAIAQCKDAGWQCQ